MPKSIFSINGLIGVVLICCIAGTFFCYNYSLAVDFPYMDDFMLIVFVQEFITTPFEITTFINKLFQSANSHKLVIPRLVALLDYSLHGSLDFKSYQVLVTLNIFFILLLFYRQFAKLSLSHWYFIPVLLWLLQPQYYDITLFGLNGLQHTFVILFTVLSLTVIQSSHRFALIGALGLCFLATFSHGNGFFSYTGILFYLLIQYRFKDIFKTAIVMAVSLIMFLYKTNDSGVVVLPDSIVTLLTSFFGFIGALFIQSASYGIYLAIAVGFAIVLFLGWIGIATFTLIRQRKDKNPLQLFWLSVFVFIASTAFVIVFLRSQSGTITSSRFHIYSPLALIVAYIVLLIIFPRLRNRVFLGAFLLMGLFVNAHSYYYYTDTVYRRHTQFLGDIYNWHNYRTMFSVGQDYIDISSYFLLPAYKEQLVLTNKPIITPHEIKSLISSEGSSIRTDITISLYEELSLLNSKRTFLISEASVPAHPNLGTNRFLVVKPIHEEQYLLLTAIPSKNLHKNLLKSRSYYQNGIRLIVREGNLSPAYYDLFILDIDASGEKRIFNVENEQLLVNEQGGITKHLIDKS